MNIPRSLRLWRSSGVLRSLRLQQGQITLEYIILFGVIAALTLVALTSWDDNIKAALEGLFLKLAGSM